MKLLLVFVPVLVFVFAVSLTKAQDALCYSEQRACEKGLVGFDKSGAPLYYEAWNVLNHDSSAYSAIVLFSDTTPLPDSIDFCLDITHRSDTVYVFIERGEYTQDYVVTKAPMVPSLVQVLVVRGGFQRFTGFNRKNSDNRIGIRDDGKLFVDYVISSPGGGKEVVTKAYLNGGGRFILHSMNSRVKDK